jgi:hypothetical protein
MRVRVVVVSQELRIDAIMRVVWANCLGTCLERKDDNTGDPRLRHVNGMSSYFQDLILHATWTEISFETSFVLRDSLHRHMNHTDEASR